METKSRAFALALLIIISVMTTASFADTGGPVSADQSSTTTQIKYPWFTSFSLGFRNVFINGQRNVITAGFAIGKPLSPEWTISLGIQQPIGNNYDLNPTAMITLTRIWKKVF